MTQGEAQKPGYFVEALLPNPIFLRETSLMRVSPLDDKNDCSLREREYFSRRCIVENSWLLNFIFPAEL